MEWNTIDRFFLEWLRREAEDLLWHACEERLRSEPCPDVEILVRNLLSRTAAR